LPFSHEKWQEPSEEILALHPNKMKKTTKCMCCLTILPGFKSSVCQELAGKEKILPGIGWKRKNTVDGDER